MGMVMTATSPVQTEARPPELFKWHLGQDAFITSWVRTTVVTAGTGSGKTSGAYFWLVARMKAFPGESWFVGFPDYGMLQRVIINQPDPDRYTLIDFLTLMQEQPQLKIMEKRIRCRSGQIFFASGEDIIGWEGAHVKGAWLDEFDDMTLAAYRMAMERTRLRLGWVLLTGTPRRVRWVREELRQPYEAGDPGIQWVQFASTANPTYPQVSFEEARSRLPSWEFQRVYLGELAAQEGGGVWKREWWQAYTDLPELRTKIMTVDTAFKETTKADYSVAATWGQAGNNYYLLDIWRAKVEYPELEKSIKLLYSRWQPSRVLVEDAASGQSLIQSLKRGTSIPVVPFKVHKDKYTRASAVTGLAEAGRVHLPTSAPWLHEFIEEHSLFPASEHDDQVDTTSMALAYFREHSGGVAVLSGKKERRVGELG